MLPKKNDVVRLTITAMSSDGSGIGKSDGYTVFVPMTDIGDTLDVLLLKVTKQFAVGKVVKMIAASDDRIENDCPVYTRCGGCCFRHISYAQELLYKRDFVLNNLRRIGKLSVDVAPVTPSDSDCRYRNKAVYPVARDRDNHVQIGFYSRRSHRVVPCEDCRLQPAAFSEIVKKLQVFFEQSNYPIYDETTQRGVLRYLYLRRGAVSGEIAVSFVINAAKLPLQNELIRLLTENFPDISGIFTVINREPGNAILTDRISTVYGKPTISDELCGVKLNISPLSFYQVNHSTAQNIYRKAAEIADLKPTDTLIDLYCGTGTIGLSMAKKVNRLIGVEIIPAAIENAKENARLNGITNAEFLCADAKDAVLKFSENKIHPDVIILDPPRKGCDPSVIECVHRMNPDRVVMISCDSATFARDLAAFAEYGYHTDTVYPFDMFPRTNHVETVCLLSHKSPDSHINVTVEFGEGEGKVPLDKIVERAKQHQPAPKATYKLIQEYVEMKYGFKVHTAYIAEVKRELGLPMYDAPNAAEGLKQTRKHPTQEKVNAIKDALNYYNLI